MLAKAGSNAILDYSPIYVNKLRELGKLTQEKRVLDVGCGWGRIAIRLEKFYPLLDLTGLDIKPESLRLAKGIASSYEQINLIVADAENLPIKDDCFDLVYSIRVLHYLNDPKRGLKEFSRVCKKGGTVIVFQPNKRNVFYSMFIKLLGETQKKFFSIKRVVELFENTGFFNVRWGSIGFIPFAWDIHIFNTKIFGNLIERIRFLNSLGSILYVAGEK
jgi:demethylmenaquinone methyltransferase/2-methoxy-6-polyprenyl-1,4-benzoquinol methylase